MICLGIEGTAHTIGVGVVDDDRIIANVYESIKPAEGIHPREAANFHAANIVSLLRRALECANTRTIELVAFSQGPGLGPCLRTVATGARALALCLDVPIIGVNHCIAHLEIGKHTTNCGDPVLLYVSGGNTQVISLSNGRYRVFGETLDIGIGNMFDKFGRSINLSFPSGPKIERLASRGAKLISLPYSIKGMDVAFSGILTAAMQLKPRARLEDICYSLQETTFAMLTEVTERAMAHLDKDEVLLGGGVAANKRLQGMLNDMVGARGGALLVPRAEYCVDNGAMIALTGLIMYKSGVRMRVEDTVVRQRFRTDEVDVVW